MYHERTRGVDESMIIVHYYLLLSLLDGILSTLPRMLGCRKMH